MSNHRYKTRLDSLLHEANTARRHHRVLCSLAAAQQRAEVFTEDVHGSLVQAGPPSVEAWIAWEFRYRHQTAGFVQAQRELIRDPRHRDLVYIGLTSSNLQDCSDALLWQQATQEIALASVDCLQAVRELEGLHRDRSGRTHGRYAAPVALWRVYARFARDLTDDIERLFAEPLLGSLGGPVGDGNDALIPPVLEMVEADLEIEIDRMSTQTSSRHRLGVAAANLTHLVGTCEQLATHHRLESISGIDGFAEGFAEGQKGSSVMPHKRNPIRSERICGLARVARGHQQAVQETANTQWWERDLTNSSVEREAFWSLAGLTLYILQETRGVLRSCTLTPDFDWAAAGEPTADELIRRVLQGENHEAVYREIQGRTHDA